VAYAIWAGVGIIAAAALGAVVFDDKLGLVQYGCIALVILGAVGLRLTTTA
jgi:multidrug transporter EmrE-like cation transporter